MKILADASLPHLSKLFHPKFELTLYHSLDEVPALLVGQTILFCRSTLKVSAQLIQDHALQCVATASSGTDHIDDQHLQQQGIQLIDAKGSNARAVADYVIATLAWLLQNKPLTGKRVGIIGLGQVGAQVQHRLRALDLDIICYDPLKAKNDPLFHSCAFEELTRCDVLCIHASLHDVAPYATRHLFNAKFFKQLKANTVIINAARGDIVDEAALLANPQPIIYCTDVYANEPSINEQIIQYATLCTPHIAGHSLEAKTNAVFQASQQLHRMYALDMPFFEMKANATVLSPQPTWQENILGVFNPINDTQQLKAAKNKATAFLAQRIAHNYRHNFNCYDTHLLKEYDKQFFD